ncbi:MAG: hypothetical protein CYG59_06520 [Chloroflexi bacterium]|nr:MAG: hypothetical protein CYG59_06520 [Chloroflexota bacterium]
MNKSVPSLVRGSTMPATEGQHHLMVQPVFELSNHQETRPAGLAVARVTTYASAATVWCIWS